MREDFTNSISRLQTDPIAAILIEYKNAMGGFTPIKDTDAGGKITTNITKLMMEKKSGSVNAFFENLIENKITNLRITNRKRNGSAYKQVGLAYECNLSAGNTATTTTPETKTTEPMQQTIGLAGGLLAPEVFKIMNHDTILNENIVLKAKIDGLEKDNRKLEIEVLKNEMLGTKSVEKSQSFNEMIEKATPLLAPLLQKMFAPAGQMTDSGLNAPELSPIKKQFISVINQMDDIFIADISKVAVMMAQNEAFDTKVTELVNQFS
jgi:hypothetical protein